MHKNRLRAPDRLSHCGEFRSDKNDDLSAQVPGSLLIHRVGYFFEGEAGLDRQDERSVRESLRDTWQRIRGRLRAASRAPREAG